MTYLDTQPATLLPLETFREWYGMHPWRFWGLNGGPQRPGNAEGCIELVRQHPWQDSDAAARDEVATAIAEAEAMLADELRYWPAPKYAEFTVPWQQVAPWHGPLHRASVTLEGGAYVQAVGVEQLTLLGAPALSFSDADGDGVNDTFSCTLTVPAGTDPASIAVYVPTADRFDGSGRSERWRIRPVRANLSGTNLTIIGRAWTAVRPLLYEGFPTNAPSGGGAPNGLDPAATTTTYCQSVEVCARTTNPNGEALTDCQAVLEWDSMPGYLGGWCAPLYPGTNSSDPAAVARVVARCGVLDAERGIVLPAAAVRNADTGEWAATVPAFWQPDRVVVRALVGKPGVIGSEMTRIICLLAAALLTRPICACADSNRQLYWYQFDLTLAGRQDELYSTRDKDLDNPFGTRRGAVQAWKAVKRLSQTRAFLLG